MFNSDPRAWFYQHSSFVGAWERTGGGSVGCGSGPTSRGKRWSSRFALSNERPYATENRRRTFACSASGIVDGQRKSGGNGIGVSSGLNWLDCSNERFTARRE